MTFRKFIGKVFSWFGFTVLIVMPLFAAHAQITGTLRGTVKNPDGTPVAFASVGLKNTTFGTQTDESGRFTLSAPAGEYTLAVSMVGRKTIEKTVGVAAGRTSEIRGLVLPETDQRLAEVVVRGRTQVQEIRESAQAIEVLDMKEATFKSADLGQVLAQTKGVAVQRSGGLGSSIRFSLNGLTDDQIRYFYNNVPLDFSAFGFGIANIPVGMLDRIEIYKGMVPSVLGADALGGAVNVLPRKPETGLHGSASYQTGSFGTHRLETSLGYQDAASSFFVNGGLYYDFSRNNYPIFMGVPDDRGRLSERTVRRFHDGYQGYGAMVETGFRNFKKLDLLSLEVYASANDRQIQNAQLGVERINGQNLIVGVPFGQVTFGRNTVGANLRYEQKIAQRWKLNAVAGYNYSQTEYVDSSSNFYNWDGAVLFRRNVQGEVENGRPSHQLLWTNNLFQRLSLTYQLNDQSKLIAQSFGTQAFRTGDERLSGSFDALGTRSRYNARVSSVEYSVQPDGDRLELNLFAKHYRVAYRSEEPTFGSDDTRTETNAKQNWGAGTGFRYRLASWMLAKISYEWATRLPRVDEVLGDGAFISDNLQLNPERGHNANLELQINQPAQSRWKWSVNPVLFWREISEHIVFLQTTARNSVYANIFNARSLGAELGLKTVTPNERLRISANATYQSYTNTSTEGLYRNQAGDRIPNRPYLFANANVAYLLPKISNDRRKLTLFGDARYVGDYFLGWESLGSRANKQVIPEQLSVNAGTTLDVKIKQTQTALTAEVFNVFNARVFDFFGSQRPGRSFFIKLSTRF